jgi:hypothetical protein
MRGRGTGSVWVLPSRVDIARNRDRAEGQAGTSGPTQPWSATPLQLVANTVRAAQSEGQQGNHDTVPLLCHPQASSRYLMPGKALHLPKSLAFTCTGSQASWLSRCKQRLRFEKENVRRAQNDEGGQGQLPAWYCLLPRCPFRRLTQCRTHEQQSRHVCCMASLVPGTWWWESCALGNSDASFPVWFPDGSLCPGLAPVLRLWVHHLPVWGSVCSSVT